MEEKSHQKRLELLMQRNLDYSKKAYENTEKIRRYIMWMRVLSVLKLVIILLPIVLALIYLPPIIMEFFSTYQGLFDQAEGLRSGDFNQLDSGILKNLLK